MYTLRDALEKDVAGTIKRVAEIGYKDIEAAAGSKGHYYGMKPAAFSKLLEDHGLKLRSSHVMITIPGVPQAVTLSNNLQKLVDDAAEAGQEYLVCAYLFEEERKSIDDYKRYVDLFNKAGEACKKAGLQFAYHNHDFEFISLDGQIPYDLLLQGTDPETMKMELDLYWISKVGLDPIKLFEKDPGRYPLWHVKDMAKTEDKNFTEVGNGVINFERIFKASKTAGLKYYFIEQDETPGDPFESIKISYKNVQKLKA